MPSSKTNGLALAPNNISQHQLKLTFVWGKNVYIQRIDTM